MSITNEKELEGMKEISWIVAEVLRKMKAYAKIGMSTLELDQYGKQLLDFYGATSAPNKDYNFPAATCISVNFVAAHGIPSDKIILKDADLINIDVSAEKNGFYGDNGESFIIGNDKRNLQSLVDASRFILNKAISKIRHGQKVSMIGKTIEVEARKLGFKTIKNLMGHGIGYKLHDGSYDLPNFNDRSNRKRFKRNDVIALETFISTHAEYVDEMSDNWSLCADDKSYITQHEHTLIITDNTPIILTANNGI